MEASDQAVRNGLCGPFETKSVVTLHCRMHGICVSSQLVGLQIGKYFEQRLLKVGIYIKDVYNTYISLSSYLLPSHVLGLPSLLGWLADIGLRGVCGVCHVCLA